MIKLLEIGISMLLLMSGVKIGELYSDNLLEIHLKNGNVLNIKTDRNNSYSCPVHCGAIHHHNAIFDNNNNNNNNYVINYSYKEGSLKLNNNEISKIYKIKIKKKKNKDKVNQKVKIDLKNFINQYNL
tara:strand:+ start:13114 stop:13497 length:384 start_codon:yes stop_codon:yes gene_type:complete